MKGKKPTRYQRQFLKEKELDTRSWLVQKDTPTEMQIVNPSTGEIKIISK